MAREGHSQFHAEAFTQYASCCLSFLLTIYREMDSIGMAEAGHAMHPCYPTRIYGCIILIDEGGRGDPSTAIFTRSHRSHTRTVELRFYNIITTINTHFLESRPFIGGEELS